MTVTAFAFAVGLALAGVAFAGTSASAPAFAWASAFEALAVGLAGAFTDLSVAAFLTLPVCFFKAGATVFTTLSTGAFAAFLVVLAGVVSFATLTSQLIFFEACAQFSKPARMLLNNAIYCERQLACKYLH
ncbi:hypothetical protein [Phyllobacterium bourgognense]|uniref:hypothetical protein n=1 Tax=Phyllobacterium bourgognense TaxID=314236 RepID=UPI001FDEA506|nr:hypothetical protein [Phyllobacterium bourgognense]